MEILVFVACLLGMILFCCVVGIAGPDRRIGRPPLPRNPSSKKIPPPPKKL